jgi:gliding motility-associated-like protein
VHTLDDDISIVTSQIHSPNGDAINDYFSISVINPEEVDFSISDKSIIFYNRENKQIASFSQFDECCIWDGRVNDKFVESGLYSYKLTINGKEMEGNFIIVRGSEFDNYVNVFFYDIDCSKNCLQDYGIEDPALYI